MSTKTSIKRIALVAATALTLGGFSGISTANAGTSATPFYVSAADSTSYGSGNNAAAMTATSVAGPYNYVKITASTDLTAGTLGVSTTGAGSTLAIAAQGGTPGTDTMTASTAGVTSATATISNGAIKVMTPTAGTVVVTIVKNVDSSGTVTTTTLQTLTITVNTASVVGAYSAANSYGLRIDSATIGSPLVTETSTSGLTAGASTYVDSATAIGKGTVGSPAGVSIIKIKLRDTQATPAAIAGVSVSATVTGVALIAGTGAMSDTTTSWASAGTVASSLTDANGVALFKVHNNGQAGTATVTLTYYDGTSTYTVSTKSYTFYGAIASLKATQGKYIVAVNGTTGGTTSTTYAVQFTGADSAGNAVDITGYASQIVGTSDSTSNIASTTSQTCAADTVNVYALDCSVAGAAGATAGATANVTYSYTDANAVKYSTSPVAFTMGGTTIASLGLTFDKSSYNVGDLVTVTLTAKDSKGFLVADKKYTVFDTSSSTTVFATSAQLTTTPFGSAYITTLKGVATATFYAPYTTNTFNMTATTNNAVVAPTTDLATALQGVAVAGSVAIAGAGGTGGDAALALDAANAATDAANNAYDEAQNATQAAQDALAAVTALAKQVSSLIASVKSLTALVSKIKAKVGA